MEDTWFPPQPPAVSATRPSGSNQDEQRARKQKDCKVGRADVVLFSLKAGAGRNPALSYSCWGMV